MIDTKQLLVDFICLVRTHPQRTNDMDNGEVADWYLSHTNMKAEQYEKDKSIESNRKTKERLDKAIAILNESARTRYLSDMSPFECFGKIDEFLKENKIHDGTKSN